MFLLLCLSSMCDFSEISMSGLTISLIPMSQLIVLAVPFQWFENEIYKMDSVSMPDTTQLSIVWTKQIHMYICIEICNVGLLE